MVSSKVVSSKIRNAMKTSLFQTETGTINRAIHAREVFMVCRPRSSLVPPKKPDVQSLDESDSNISPDAQGHDSEAEI
jgi:hypothetical protein